MFDNSFLVTEVLRFYSGLHAGKRKVIESFKDELTDKTVLDFGCGTGFYTKIIASRAKHVYAYDTSTVGEEFNPASNITYTTKLPEKYDVIICNDSLEFNPDWKDLYKSLVGDSTKVYIIAPNFHMKKSRAFSCILKLAGLYHRFQFKQKTIENIITDVESSSKYKTKYVLDFDPDTLDTFSKKYFFLQDNPLLNLFNGSLYCNHVLYTK